MDLNGELYCHDLPLILCQISDRSSGVCACSVVHKDRQLAAVIICLHSTAGADDNLDTCLHSYYRPAVIWRASVVAIVVWGPHGLEVIHSARFRFGKKCCGL